MYRKRYNFIVYYLIWTSKDKQLFFYSKMVYFFILLKVPWFFCGLLTYLRLLRNAIRNNIKIVADFVYKMKFHHSPNLPKWTGNKKNSTQEKTFVEHELN